MLFLVDNRSSACVCCINRTPCSVFTCS